MDWRRQNRAGIGLGSTFLLSHLVALHLSQQTCCNETAMKSPFPWHFTDSNGMS